MVLRPLIALVLASLAGACTIDGPNVDIDGKVFRFGLRPPCEVRLAAW